MLSSLIKPPTKNTYYSICPTSLTAPRAALVDIAAYIGAPYCDGKLLAEELASYNFKGVIFENITFKPQTIASNSNPPKYIGELCGGVFINVTDKNTFEPFRAVIAILVSLKKLFPEFQINKNNFLDKLSGTKDLRIMLNNGNSYDEIISTYETQLTNFKIKRDKHLLYK